MTPSARAHAVARHARRACRRGTAPSCACRRRPAARAERRLRERLRLPEGQLVQRRAAADQLVVVHHLLEALGRDAPAAHDVVEERADLLRAGRAAEGDQQDGVGGAIAPLSAPTARARRRPARARGRPASRQDAVAEVEDVPGPPGGLPEDRRPRGGGSRRSARAARRIEVALHRDVVPEPRPRRRRGRRASRGR